MFNLNQPMYGQSPSGQYDPTGLDRISNGMLPPVMQQAQKPGAFGKGGWAWKIIGSIGDAITNTDGGQGTYIPHILDLQKQTQDERKLQEQYAQQAALKQQELQAQAIAPTPEQKLLADSANWTQDQWARHAALHPNTVMGPDGPQLVDPRAILKTFGVGQPPAAPLTASDWYSAKPLNAASGTATPSGPSSTISQAEFLRLRQAMGPDKALNYIRSQNIAIGN
jgi:hypothetical protein